MSRCGWCGAPSTNPRCDACGESGLPSAERAGADAVRDGVTYAEHNTPDPDSWVTGSCYCEACTRHRRRASAERAGVTPERVREMVRSLPLGEMEKVLATLRRIAAGVEVLKAPAAASSVPQEAPDAPVAGVGGPAGRRSLLARSGAIERHLVAIRGAGFTWAPELDAIWLWISDAIRCINGM